MGQSSIHIEFIYFLLSICICVSDGKLPPRIHSLNMLEPIPIQDAIGRDTLRLVCSASGNPVPKLSWSFNGVVFVDGQPFGTQTEIRHEITRNRLTLRPINSKLDTGKYRCIATNTIGSVFIEKHIKIRELGEFNPGSTKKDQARKFYPTIGRPFIIDCPPHRTGYGTTYHWGIVHVNNQIEEFLPARPFKNAYPNGKIFEWSFITRDDIKRSTDTGGVQCILKNLGQFVSSVKSVLWNPYATRMESRKPRMSMHMPPQMKALVNTEFSIYCGAINYPPSKISWQYQGQGVRSRWLNNSEELNFEFYRLLEGGHRLSIRRVTKYSGGTFKCYAENALGKIWRIGQLTVMFPPKWTVKFPDNVNVPVGNTYQINCTASGVPQPRYEWYHNGTIITNDLNRKVEGGLLTLIESRYKDDGIYICLAISELDTLSQSTYIYVEAMAPKFIAPINNPIYIFKQANQDIACRVVGGPRPKITWFHNDTELTGAAAEGYEFLADGTLRIKMVTDKHNGIFRCEASNSIGTEKGEGITDLVEPTIITHPPSNLTYQVGWPYLTMFCGASYDKRLDLRIEWYKGGVRLMKFVGNIALEGRASGPPRLLFINDVTVDDRGNYSCHAYTKIGDVISEQWAHGRLRIKVQQLLRSTLQVRTHKILWFESIVWVIGITKINGRTFAPLSVFHYDVMMASASMTGPPEPAAGVTVTGSCMNMDARITWSRGEELEAPTRKFYIEFKTLNSTEWFTGHKPGEVFFAEPGTITYFNLDERHLPPGANLIFRLRSASDHLIGRPSKPSKSGLCITQPGAPMINPYNVSSYTQGPGTFIIKWKPVTEVYLGAPDFKYIVGYKKEDDATFTKKEISDSKIGEHKVENPGIGVKYTFYVQSSNSLGLGPDPLIFTNFTGKIPLTIQPRFLRVESVQRYFVELRWETVEGADGYQVTYWNVTDSEAQRGHTPEYFRKKRSVSDTPYELKTQLFVGSEFKNGASLSNLTADQEFMASVAAVNNGGIGPNSYPITFRTAERVPGVPTRVRFQTYGRSARIQWNPPDNPNGYIEEYRIIWYKTDPHDRSAAETLHARGFLRPLREAYLLNVFEPLTYYTIKLQCRNRIGPGYDWQRELMAVSVEDIPGKPDPPTCTPFDDTAINVTFNLASYGGFPTKFRVMVRARTFYYKEQLIYEQLFPNRTWILITGLKFITYDFHTVALNAHGQSETSDVVEQRPIRRPNRQKRAHTFEWWRSNYFIWFSLILLWLIVFAVTILITLRKNQPKIYPSQSPEKKARRLARRGITLPSGGFLRNRGSKAIIDKDGSIEQIIDQPPPYPVEEFITASATQPLLSAPSIKEKEASIEKIDIDEEEVEEDKEEQPESKSNTESETETDSDDSSSYSDWSSDDGQSDASKRKMYSDDEYEKGGLGIGGEVGRSTEILNDGQVRVASNVRYQSDGGSSIDQATGIYL